MTSIRSRIGIVVGVNSNRPVRDGSKYEFRLHPNNIDVAIAVSMTGSNRLMVPVRTKTLHVHSDRASIGPREDHHMPKTDFFPDLATVDHARCPEWPITGLECVQ